MENLSELRQEICQKAKSNKKKIVLFWAIYVALYLNFGWVVGNYYAYKLPTIYKENPTLVAKIVAGGWGVFAAPKGKEGKERTEAVQDFFIVTVLFWPAMLFLSALCPATKFFSS